MRKGVIPIPYIVALIFGVAVIALLGYLFVAQGGKTIKGGTEAECQAKNFAFCMEWQNNHKDCDLSKIPIITIEGCPTPTKDDCLEIGLCKG